MAMSGSERQQRYRTVHQITARDRLVLCKGLAYAITTIERLPREQQEWSDKEDMRILLDRFAPSPPGVEFFHEGAIRHIDGIGFSDD